MSNESKGDTSLVRTGPEVQFLSAAPFTDTSSPSTPEICPDSSESRPIRSGRSGGKNESCALYRHFDAKGRLLYIGISVSALERLARHRSRSKWFTLITNVSIQHFKTRKAALKAEKLAIKNELPRYNMIYSNDSRSFRKERIAFMELILSNDPEAHKQIDSFFNMRPEANPLKGRKATTRWKAVTEAMGWAGDLYPELELP